MDTTTILAITQSITGVLLIWSEYLGTTPRHKSNAVIDLLICGLSKMRTPENATNASQV
jgi:hypothetical protein